MVSNTTNELCWTEDELIERLRKGQEEAYRVLVIHLVTTYYG